MNKHNHYLLFLGILFVITCFNAFAQDKILEPIPFALVKEKPLFQGGDSGKFSTWVKSHLSEKVIAPEYVGKRVTAQVLVNVDGSLSAKIIRGVSDTIDKEIVKIIESSPKWQPGRNNDTVVPVNINMPIIIPGREETNVGIQKNTNRSSTNNPSTTTAAGEKAGDISLVVNGEGATKTEATKNALRSAIEQAFGVFVSASTEILNDELVRDEIATVASGNIKSYKELSSMALPNGNSSVTLSAIVSIGNLVQYAQSHGSSAEFAGQTFMMNIKMKELNRRNELQVLDHMVNLLEGSVSSMYDYNLKIDDPAISGDKYRIRVHVEVVANKNYILFVKHFCNILSSLSLSPQEYLDYFRIEMPVNVYNPFHFSDKFNYLEHLGPNFAPNYYILRNSEQDLFDVNMRLVKILNRAISSFIVTPVGSVSGLYWVPDESEIAVYGCYSGKIGANSNIFPSYSYSVSNSYHIFINRINPDNAQYGEYIQLRGYDSNGGYLSAFIQGLHYPNNPIIIKIVSHDFLLTAEQIATLRGFEVIPQSR